MKKVKQRIISAFMAAVMLFTSVTFADILSKPVSALGDKTASMIFMGYRLFAKALSVGLMMEAEAEGSPEYMKAAGLVNSVLLLNSGGAATNRMNEITQLCQQILSELKQIEVQMSKSFAIVEQILGEQNAAAAKKAQDDKWQADVEDVINKYNAGQALDQYLVYMDASAKYAENQSDAALKKEYEKEKNTLVQKFALMYSNQIPLEVIGDDEKLRDYIFSGDKIDKSFILLIDELSSKLVKTNSSAMTLADTAAQTADAYFPFSHQQYQFIYTVIEEQLMELTDSILLAAEYYDLQGDYILSRYGEDSDLYKGYRLLTEQINDVVYGTGNSSAMSRIEKMLNTKMTVSANVQKSLNDYMRPEDAVSAVMEIQDYQEKAMAKDESMDIVMTHKKYIDQYVNFNRVMADDTVYYIIDPKQFENDPLALSTSALDCKADHAGGDWHVMSMDYKNLIKPMSDGNNTFSVSSDKNPSVYDSLIATNSFLTAGSVPETYLQGYIPQPTDKNKTLYFITSSFKDHKGASFVFKTYYADCWLIEAFKSFSSGTLKTVKATLQNLQKDHDGDKKKFTVVLAQVSEEYQQSLSLKTQGAGLESVTMTATPKSGDPVEIKNGEEKAVISGGKLSINVKLEKDSEIVSVKCIRDLDPFSDSGDSEYEIIGEGDFDYLTPDSDGSYTIDYVIPYSNARIVVETRNHEDNFENGFCTECGKYQAAVRNDAGAYEIGNGGQLFWFAEMVNGTAEHSIYNKQEPKATAILTDDIDLENREWTPINNFSGIFDGQRYSISNMSITKAEALNIGMFGILRGELKNLTLEGYISVPEKAECVGGVVGHLAAGGKVSLVLSDVNISFGYGAKDIGGIVGRCYGELIHCGYVGTTKLSQATNVGGIAGTMEPASRMMKCFSYGNITVSFPTGNVLRPYVYDRCGAVVGELLMSSVVSYCYYRDPGNGIKAVYKDSGAFTKDLKEISTDQFKSGWLAFELNDKVTDGTQPWYQNIDNRGDKDNYPKLIGGTVYKSGDGYTNLTPGHTGTFTGIPLEDVNIGLEPCEGAEEGYDTFVSLLGEDLKNVYRITVTHKEGDVIPADKWTWKDIKISLSADSENVCLAFINEEGKLVYCAADSFENGTCTFVLPKLYPLIALCTKDGASDNNGDNNPPTGDGKDMTACIAVAAVSLAFAAIVAGRRKKHNG